MNYCRVNFQAGARTPSSAEKRETEAIKKQLSETQRGERKAKATTVYKRRGERINRAGRLAPMEIG